MDPLVRRATREKIDRLLGIVESLSLRGVILASDSMNRWLLGKGLSSISIVRRDGVRIYVPVLEYTRARDHLERLEGVEVIAYQRYPLEPPEDFPVIAGGVDEILMREFGSREPLGCDLSASSKRVIDMLMGRCIDITEDIFRIRAVKTEAEVEAIERAASIASEAFEEALKSIGENTAEREAAGILDHVMRIKGADGYAFPTIVASGPNASYPHAEPGDRRIQRGDLVVIDMGSIWRGYASDMTRMLAVGNPGSQGIAILEAVEEALNRSLERVAPGVRASEIDEVARKTLSERGLGRYYIHATGHGVGVEVHEPPLLSSSSRDVLEKGSVITIEPGIYIPGKIGARLEELVLVTGSGYRVLTRARRIITI